MVTYATGQRLTSTVGAGSGTGPVATRIVRDVASDIALLDPNEYPLVVLLSKLRKLKARSPRYEWYEDEFAPIYVTTGGAESSTDTAIAIGSGEGDYLKKYDVLLNMETGEAVLITTAAGTDTLTVVRGFGGTDAQAMGSADKLFNIGNAADEGGSSLTALSTVKTLKENYTQIFKHTVDVSRTSESTRMYGGNDRAYLRRKGGVEIAKAFERAFWFGAGGENTSAATGPVRSTGGILNASYGITTNTTTNTNQLTEDNFEEHLESGMRYGPKVKTCFASPRGCSNLRKIGVASGTINLTPMSNTYGLSITRYISGHGELNIIPTKLFYDMADSNATSGTWGDPSQLMVILDMEQLNYMFLDDVKLHTNVQNNDVDGFKDQYIAEIGVRTKLEKHHSYIINVDLAT